MDCGGVPEINVVIHICLDSILAIISIAMLFKLGLMNACDIGDTSGCRYFWWVMCLWNNLAVFNVLLVYHHIKNYPTRRRGNRKLAPRIMFTRSGDPVAVTLSPATSAQLSNSRHSVDSLCFESDRDDVNRSHQSAIHIV
ncbi:hypothetical protein F4805DRAFT_443274 [Annulohypoxylon moriforme]|nr:hypothetical protein F4805DRAFT_443274 [Annulohypoxylon moriforme]